MSFLDNTIPDAKPLDNQELSRVVDVTNVTLKYNASAVPGRSWSLFLTDETDTC